MSKSTVNPGLLKKKYEEERERRLLSGSRDYLSVTDRFARYFEAAEGKRLEARAPIEEDVDVAIMGGGLAGLTTAGHCRMRGIERIRIIDKAADFGGVWFWNQYPGAACDVESYIYMPFLEETGYIPKERYASAEEIFEHAQRIGRHFALYDDALFETQVISADWDEGSCRWIVKTNRGDTLRARFISLSFGAASLPKLPSIPGLETFKGHSFHTSRWDFSYTGGSNRGDLVGLKNKRVVVIGTGATAVQIVPAIAEWCEHLYVVQRTPSTIDVRGNRPTDPEWAKNLSPGWQRERLHNFENMTLGIRQPVDMVSDGWTDTSIKLFIRPREIHAERGGDFNELSQLADYEKMEELRSRVGKVVKDPATAESLKPYFNVHCKRPCFHDEYLEAFNRDDVTLIDTKGASVEQITETGFVANGVEYPVDCIIFATGFEIVAKPTRAGQISVSGVNGKSLADHWSDGYRSLHGIFVHDFPNLSIIGGVRDSGGSFNINIVLDGQGEHVAEIFSRCLKEDIRRLEVTVEAEDGWRRTMREKNTTDHKFLIECTPSYLNAEGAGGDESLRVAVYGGGTFEYLEHLKNTRETEFKANFVTEPSLQD